MKGLFQTIRNIFKIQELKSRIFISLGFILVYRLCAFVTLPMGSENREALQNSLFSETSSEGLLGILNLFTGGSGVIGSLAVLLDWFGFLGLFLYYHLEKSRNLGG